jgi:predicted DNA-binding ribbon-helix-helix protein
MPEFRKSRLINRNVRGPQCRTSIRLEPEFWAALDDICKREQLGRNELVRRVESAAPEARRTSAVRVFILQYFHCLATVRPELCGNWGLPPLARYAPDLVAGSHPEIPREHDSN